MNKTKEFLEGKEAALKGELRFPNPYRQTTEKQYKDWAAGWKVGYDEWFENMPPEEKAKYWERQWRQAELEKHIAFRHLSKMADLSEEIWEEKSQMENPLEKVIYQNGHGSLTLGDCLEAERFIMSHGCADIKEITEYEDRKWKEFCEANDIKWEIKDE